MQLTRLQNNFSYSPNGSRNCCTYIFSVGVLTYIFIYSSFSHTHLRILLLEPCTFPICACFALYHLTLAVAVFILSPCKLYLNMCSVELLGWVGGGSVLAMNNFILTKWHIALSHKTRVHENH